MVTGGERRAWRDWPLVAAIHGSPIGQYWRGFLRGWLRPSRNNEFGGPMNGQAQRQALTKRLCQRIPFGMAIETGSYFGDTTGFIAESIGGPVATIEAQRYQHAYCKGRYFGQRRIHCLLGDSRDRLPRILENLHEARESPCFFYLDAHWEEELPLFEEVSLILASTVSAVVMVDDFQVPGDDGYGFDDYGTGKALTLEYLQPLIGSGRLAAFFPAAPSSAETGAVRGCVVLCTEDLQEAVAGTTGLRPLRDEDWMAR